MPKKSMEVKFLQSAIGKKVTVEFYRGYVEGKLVNVNERNLTLYLEDSDGNTVIVPFRAKHIYRIIVHPNKEQI